MLYNKYKNRIKLILELFFHFKRFIRIKNSYKEEIINKEKSILEKEFEDKLNFIKFTYSKKGIIKNTFEKPLLIISIANKEDIFPLGYDTIYKINEEKKKIKKLYFSYSNSDVPLEYIKKEVSLVIAEYLVEYDFINTHFKDNNIIFTINVF